MTTQAQLYIGLMSGTSMDGIDGVLVDLSQAMPRTLAFAHQPYDAAVRAELMALQSPCDNELHRAMMMSNAVSEGYAAVVHQLLKQAQLSSESVVAIGAHGQTVRHQPQAKPQGYTVQLLNGALLVERTRIAVVSNFRGRDIAAGGQGAPLVPAFHAACFALPGKTQVVCNIGGIANITLLHGNGRISGFDTGPGNCLLDAWAEAHLGTPYDAEGNLAARGEPHAALLDALLQEPYFHAPPPKSTGRDLFNAEWLAAKLSAYASLKPEDVQASLCALTARTIADAVHAHARDARSVWVCGGGAFNRTLMQSLSQQLRQHSPQCELGTTAERGVPEMHVEALAFAWLAQQHIARKTGNLPAVTGASRKEILGDYTPTL